MKYKNIPNFEHLILCNSAKKDFAVGILHTFCLLYIGAGEMLDYDKVTKKCEKTRCIVRVEASILA